MVSICTVTTIKKRRSVSLLFCVTPFKERGWPVRTVNLPFYMCIIYRTFTKYYTNIVPSRVFWFEVIQFPTFSSDGIKEVGSWELEAILAPLHIWYWNRCNRSLKISSFFGIFFYTAYFLLYSRTTHDHRTNLFICFLDWQQWLIITKAGIVRLYEYTTVSSLLVLWDCIIARLSVAYWYCETVWTHDCQ
jgi:hypothetical protein